MKSIYTQYLDTNIFTIRYESMKLYHMHKTIKQHLSLVSDQLFKNTERRQICVQHFQGQRIRFKNYYRCVQSKFQIYFLTRDFILTIRRHFTFKKCQITGSEFQIAWLFFMMNIPFFIIYHIYSNRGWPQIDTNSNTSWNL